MKLIQFYRYGMEVQRREMTCARLSIRPREGPGIESPFPEHWHSCEQDASFIFIAVTLEEGKGKEIWNEVIQDYSSCEWLKPSIHLTPKKEL